MDYITDEMVVKRARAAVQLALDKNKAIDVPSVIYDPTDRKIYEVYSDGSRKLLSGRLRESRYGE